MLATTIVRTLSGSLVAAALLATGAIGATVVQSHASDSDAQVVIATPAAAALPATWTMPAPVVAPVASHQSGPAAMPAATPRPTPHATKAPVHHAVHHASATPRPTAAPRHHTAGSHDGHGHGGGHGDCWD